MHPSVGFGYALGEIVTEQRIGPYNALESAQQAYSAVLQRLQIEVGAAQVHLGAANQLQRVFLTRSSDVRHLIDRTSEPTGRL
jgi:hypothetical protein